LLTACILCREHFAGDARPFVVNSLSVSDQHLQCSVPSGVAAARCGCSPSSHARDHILPPHSGSTGQSVIISSSVCSCYYSAIAAFDCSCEWLESAASHFYWQPPVSQWWSHADASHALTHDSCHAAEGDHASSGDQCWFPLIEPQTPGQLGTKRRLGRC
jgi:hypothetical protein